MEQPIQFEPPSSPYLAIPAAVLRDLSLYRGPAEPTRCVCKHKTFGSGFGHRHECPRGAELRLVERERRNRRS